MGLALMMNVKDSLTFYYLIYVILTCLYDKTGQQKQNGRLYNFMFYLLPGGLAAVIYTDTLQTVIMLGGALVLCIIGEYYIENVF